MDTMIDTPGDTPGDTAIHTTPSDTTAFDTVVVGAGIAGAALAWQLLQDAPQHRVLLLEREAQPGMHSTGRSAAMWMPSYGPPAVRALTRASGPFYAAPPPGFSDVPLLPPRGVLYVAAPGQQATLDALQAELAPACPGLQRLDAAATLARAPWLRADQLLGSLWDAQSTDIDVHALHQGFLRGFRREGGLLRCGAELLSAQWHAGQGWQIALAGGSTLQATRLVNAAGAWGDMLAARCGVAPVGLVPRRRSAFTFRAPAGVATASWPRWHRSTPRARAGTSSPMPASCWAHRPMPTPPTRRTCSPKSWTSRWPSTASRPPPRCMSAGPPPPGRGCAASSPTANW